jgi:predicted DNA-binding protein
MPKPAPKAARPRQTAIRFDAETHAFLDALAEHYRPSPEATITTTAIIKKAIREMAERDLKRTKKR